MAGGVARGAYVRVSWDGGLYSSVGRQADGGGLRVCGRRFLGGRLF